jgi:translocation and assembly module TamA
LRIGITPMTLNLFETGVSVGTDTGVALEGLYERRWVNRKGHWFRTRLAPGTDLSTFEATYNIPHSSRLDRQFAIGLQAVDEITDSNKKQNFSVSLARQSLWGRWRRAEAVRYLDERFIVGGDRGESILLLLQGGLSRAKPSKTMVPDSGWALAAAYKIASDSLGSDTSMLQLDLRGKGIFSFGEKNRLLSRAHVGITMVDDFDKLPVSLRYFAGGDRNVRGFDYESIGPVNDQGLVIGGKHMIVGSIEYERKLTDLFRIATFLDVGNAFNDAGDTIEAGAGLGFRMATPIGMIRLDLAHPVSDSDQGFRIHFTVGPDL